MPFLVSKLMVSQLFSSFGSNPFRNSVIFSISLMMDLLEHLFTFAEIYTVCLAWVCIPLGFYASYLLMTNHFGMFAGPNAANAEASRAVEVTHALH